jgi:hypothetical protein
MAEAQDQLTIRTPEPASLALFGVGMLGLTVTKRRTKK